MIETEENYMQVFTEAVNSTAESEDFFLMANLSPRTTGLPFVVWVSPKGGAAHDIRVKVSRGSRVTPSDLIPVAIRPEIRVIGNAELSSRDLEMLRQWVELNRDALIRFWDGDIEYTEDLLAELKRLD